MLRSHERLDWFCCGKVQPASYRHCPSCGSAVMTATRVLVRLPIRKDGGFHGDIAVVANAEVNAETWRFLGELVTNTAILFEKEEAKAQPEPAAVAPHPETPGDQP